jgi:methylated-DNA-protein-cysteine methyltransferase related protein
LSDGEPSVERERRIIDVLMALQPGEVTTYGDIADTAGYPRLARLVGRILSTTDVDVPWWRVVTASGRLVPGHELTQSELLGSEDVTVRQGRVAAAPFGRFADDRRVSGRSDRTGRSEPSRRRMPS